MELQERVGKVEDGLARLSADVRVIGHDQAGLKSNVEQVKAGIDQLLQREAARPHGITGQTIAATCGGLAAVAAVVWWLIGASPAVQEIGRRLDRLDDPETGRVLRLERELGWAAKVVKAKP